MGDSSDKGICILSFDSGGCGSYSQFLVIKRYIGCLAAKLHANEEDVYPADHFDLIGGVGFGGLAALMLGHLRMTAKEAEAAFLTISNAVFPCNSDARASPEINSRNLKVAIEEILKARKIPLDAKMHDTSRPPTKCKVAFYAATSANISHSRAFRTYPLHGTKSNSLNPTIVEALCATISILSLFSPVKIGPHMREQEFVGGGVGANNPTRELLKEASAHFGNDTRVAQIISLGAGRPRALSLKAMDTTGMASRLLKSLATDCETVAKDLSNRLFNVDAYIRLNVPNDNKNTNMEDRSGLAVIESQTSAYLETAEVSRDIDVSLRYLQNKTGTATLGQINYSSNTKLDVKAVPALSPHYVVRQEWVTLVNHLLEAPSSTQNVSSNLSVVPPSTQKVFSITGMAGCGKTQLVSYFLQEKGSLYPHLIFVDASSEFTLKSDLQAWSRSLGADHAQDVWEDALSVLSSDIYRGKWILILDNADDPKMDLAPFLPKCYHGIVIITSRNRNAGDIANTYHLELGEMREDEAFSTLLKAAQRQLPMSSEETESAHALAKQLGYLAVALVQAGTYCYQLSATSTFTFAEYAALFTSQRAELMKQAQPQALDNYTLGAYASFDLSYKAIPQCAKDMLHFTASFDHTSMSLSICAAASARGFNDEEALLPRPDDHGDVISKLETLLCPEGEWNETRVHETIRILRSFSLISASSTMDVVFIHLHPLVHAWARDMTSNSQFYQRMSTQVITSCLYREELHHYLLPHIQTAVEASTANHSHVNDQLVAAVVLRGFGYYDEAERLLRLVLESVKQAGKGNGEAYLNATTLLGLVYFKRGKWDDAEVLQLKVLKGWRQLRGREDPSTIGAASNLAVTYSNQGRYEEAAVLGLEALEGERSLLGQDDPKTIITAANLAINYRRMGRYKEAEVLELEILEQQRSQLGREHPDTIRAAATLASTYNVQGRYKEAEALELEVLEQRRKLLGHQHPETITAMANIAGTYRDQGRYKEAEVFEVEVLACRERSLGQEHPETIQAAANLAGTYGNQGRHAEAQALALKVLEQQRRLYGHDHPRSIRAAESLAWTHMNLGRDGEAEVLQVDVLERRRRLLGRKHPNTIQAAANLAAMYGKQGRSREAEVIQTEVLQLQRRVLGQQHPDTFITMASLANTYHSQGRYKEAEVLEVEVLVHRRRLLGKGHPDTTLAAESLAATYKELGRLREAEALEVEVLEQLRRVLGHEHPRSIMALSNLAVTHANKRAWWMAAALLFEGVNITLQRLGPKDPLTKQRVTNLAFVLSMLGMADSAEDIKELFS